MVIVGNLYNFGIVVTKIIGHILHHIRVSDQRFKVLINH